MQCTFDSKPARKTSKPETPSSSGPPTTSTSASHDYAQTIEDQIKLLLPEAELEPSPKNLERPALSFVDEKSPVPRHDPSLHVLTDTNLLSAVSHKPSSLPSSFSSPQRIYYRTTQSRDDEPAAKALEYSLEDGKDLTAHFIGLSGEQDTDLLASIRYNVLNETSFVEFNIRKVFPGDRSHQKPPIHFSMLHDAFPERDQRAKRSASDAIEHHVRGHGDALLRLYFRFIHPLFPILSKARILKNYVNDKLSIPASLRGAIYGLACAFWDQDQTLRGLLPVTQPELFEYSHVALNRELDSPKLSTLQACLLVLHEQPDAHGTTESPKVWTYACQATACAQSLGLHQDPSPWKLEKWEKSLRRKLWWATYYTDRWTSICHGNPTHITESSFDTSDLDLEDLAADEDVIGLPGWSLVAEEDRTFDKTNALQFLEVVKLSKVLSDVLSNSL